MVGGSSEKSSSPLRARKKITRQVSAPFHCWAGERVFLTVDAAFVERAGEHWFPILLHSKEPAEAEAAVIWETSQVPPPDPCVRFQCGPRHAARRGARSSTVARTIITATRNSWRPSMNATESTEWKKTASSSAR